MYGKKPSTGKKPARRSQTIIPPRGRDKTKPGTTTASANKLKKSRSRGSK